MIAKRFHFLTRGVLMGRNREVALDLVHRWACRQLSDEQPEQPIDHLFERDQGQDERQQGQDDHRR